MEFERMVAPYLGFDSDAKDDDIQSCHEIFVNWFNELTETTRNEFANKITELRDRIKKAVEARAPTTFWEKVKAFFSALNPFPFLWTFIRLCFRNLTGGALLADSEVVG